MHCNSTKHRRRVAAYLLSAVLLFTFATPVAASVNLRNGVYADALTKDEILYEISLIMEYIDTKYMGEPVTREQLREGLLRGLTSSLDDYSEYFSEEDFADFMDSINGSIVGAGVTLVPDGDYVTIDYVLEDSPASKAGVLAGDKILEIDGKSIEKIDYTEVANSIRGEEKTTVTLTVLRDGKKITIPIVRAHITDKAVVLTPISEVLDAAEGYDDKIGYIKLKTFGDGTQKEFFDAVAALKADGIKVLILDLRNNNGGFIETCTQIARMLVPKGAIFSVVEKGVAKRTYTSFLREAPFEIIVLVNQNTASCAEILASAIKDSNTGILVGQVTYGKGVGQSLLSLANGGELKLTTMEWVTRSGDKINKMGITPNVTVELNALEDKEDTVLETGFKEALKRIGKRK